MPYHRPLNLSWWKQKLQVYTFICATKDGPLPEDVDREAFGAFISNPTATPGVRLWAFEAQEAREVFMNKYGAKLL